MDKYAAIRAFDESSFRPYPVIEPILRFDQERGEAVAVSQSEYKDLVAKLAAANRECERLTRLLNSHGLVRADG